MLRKAKNLGHSRGVHINPSLFWIRGLFSLGKKREIQLWTLPGDSQRESGRFARIDSRESGAIRRKVPIFITPERFARIASNMRFAVFHCAAKGGTQKGIGHFFRFRSPFGNHFVTFFWDVLGHFFAYPLLPPPFCGRVNFLVPGNVIRKEGSSVQKPSGDSRESANRFVRIRPSKLFGGCHSTLAHQNRTIAIASDFRVDGAKSPEIPQKEGGLGSEIAARNRKSLATFHRTLKSQCSIAFSCLGNRCDFWGPRWASQSQIAKIAAISVR